jgi:outer membrane protein OmpA-like peptidoglycan-associated protein
MSANWKYKQCCILLCCMIFFIPCRINAQGEHAYCETIYFTSGSYTLNPSETHKLFQILHDTPYLTSSLEISGFTDSVGTLKSNMQLSANRSKSVVDWFAVYNRRIKYEVKNFGELNPVNIDELSLNRRVEICYRKRSSDPKTPDSGTLIVVRKIELENIYFKPDEAILEPASMPYLNQLAEILKKDKRDRFEIRGHVNWHPRVTNVSDSGYRVKMFKLSEDRAKTIYDILIDQGVPATQMNWKGMGNTEMIFPNASNDVEKRRNMRVDILIIR